MQIPNIAFLSAVGVISPHRLRGGSFLFFGRICKLQFFIERKNLSWPWNWTYMQQRSGDSLSGKSPIMHNETPAPPCLHLHRSWSLRCVLFFNIDAYLKGIFEFPCIHDGLRCLDSILFNAPLAEWSALCDADFYLHRPAALSLLFFHPLKKVKQYLTFFFSYPSLGYVNGNFIKKQ